MRKSNALPGLDLLVGFEAAARHLSFTKAGAELYRTQSAVSRQIKELEDQLGVTLFQRRHRALALTEPGHQLYAAAAQVLATMRSATERLRRQPGRRRPLSVTTTNSFAALWLIPQPAGQGSPAFKGARCAVQEQRRPGARLFRRRSAGRRRAARGGRLYRMAESRGR